MNGLNNARPQQGLFLYGLKSLAFVACLTVFGASQTVASSTTLEALLNGSSLTVGQSQFSDWELVGVSSAALNPDFSRIDVVPVNDPNSPGLQFVSNGQLSTSGVGSIDLTVNYRVTALSDASLFVGQKLELTGVGAGGGGGIVFVSEETADGAGVDLGSTLVLSDHRAGFFMLQSSSDFASTSELSIALNVFVTSLSSSDSISLDSFTQHFLQSGPGALTGDYNQDGAVNAADFVLWRNTFGQTGPNLAADGDGDHVVDDNDYDLWKTNFGTTAGSGQGLSSSAHASASVPEPTTFVLLLIGPIALVRRFRVLA